MGGQKQGNCNCEGLKTGSREGIQYLERCSQEYALVSFLS